MTAAQPASREEPATLDARVVREQLAVLYGVYAATLMARSTFIVVLGAFIVHSRERWTLPVVAVVTGHLLFYLFIWFTPRWTPAEPVERNGYWLRKVTVMVTALGFADAIALWVFMPDGDLLTSAVLMVVVLGIAFRAIQSLRPLRSAMLGNTLPPMLTLVAELLLDGGLSQILLAAFASLFYVLMLRAGAQDNRILNQALTLRFENESLARQLAEQVAQTQRVSAEKTRFFAAASHDLRQPLHAIALFGAALESAVDGRPEGVHAGRLMHAVHTLGESLDTLLDVSRLDAGVVLPVMQRVSLDKLFVTLNNTFSPQAEKKALQLRVRASGLWVHGDPALLQRLLSNLVDNAIKYTQQGGVIVAARARGEQVWVEVRDTGIGIAPSQRERVFEEFYQVDNPARDRARGLGIGLAIVRRLARLMALSIELRSQSGRGSRFRIMLPRMDAPAPPASDGGTRSAGQGRAPLRTGVVPSPDLAGMRLLLLEDEQQVHQAMDSLLRPHGVVIVPASIEAEAADALRRAAREDQRFDLLLSDLRLADGEDGLQACERLRVNFDASLPVLLVTGETSPQRLQRVREVGWPVLYKPVAAAQLMAALALHRRDAEA